MKQKLLLIILPVLIFTATLQAQNKVWDFGNDTANFPVAPGFSDTQVRDGLTLVGGGSNFATVEANSSTWPDTYSSTNRLKSEGSSSVSSGLPTRRYMEFPVSGPVAVKLWFRFSGTSLPRSVEVTDATGGVIMRLDSSGDTDPKYIEANYTGAAGNLLVFSDGNAVNYYKLEISSNLLSSDDFKTGTAVNVTSAKDRIYVSNVRSKTQVDIYSLTGALVKSFETSTDTDFQFKTGLWIATVKAEDGQKSVKLVTQ